MLQNDITLPLQGSCCPIPVQMFKIRMLGWLHGAVGQLCALTVCLLGNKDCFLKVFFPHIFVG